MSSISAFLEYASGIVAGFATGFGLLQIVSIGKVDGMRGRLTDGMDPGPACSDSASTDHRIEP